MSRYIDAEKLIRRLKERYDALVDAYDIWDAYTQGFGEAFEMAEDVLDEIPTADVVEVKHGKWIDKEGDDEGACSQCRFNILDIVDSCWGMFSDKFDPYEDAKYCPNCGARMDGEIK